MFALSPATRGSLFYFAFFGTLAAWLPFINIYFRNLGLSGWDIGLLSGVIPAGTLLLSPALTALADRSGRHLLALALATVGMGCALALLSRATHFLVLLAFMALLAVFYSATTPLGDSTIIRMAARHGLNYGGMRLWGSLGYALMAVVCGALWQRFGYLAMFGVAGGLYLVAAVFGSRLERIETVEKHNRVPLRSLAGDRFLLLVLLSTFLVSSAVGMDMTFAGVYMTHLGGQGLFVGLLFGFSAMFELPALHYSNRLAGAIGSPACLLAAYSLFALAYLGYAISPNPAVMVAFSLFRGFAFGLFYATTIRILAERAPAAWTGTVQGIMNAIAFGLAQLLARVLSGAIYDSLGPAAVFFAATVGAVSAAVLIGGVMLWRPVPR